MNDLSLDSMVPPDRFDDLAPVQPERLDCPGEVHLRPRHEVAVLLVLSGVTEDVLTEQQIAAIEDIALRKLRRDPRIQELYREIIGRSPAVA